MKEQHPSAGGPPSGGAGKAPFISRIVPLVVGTLLAIGLAVLLFWQSVFVRILPGEVGVLYSLLFGGTQIEKIYYEGFALKFPWDKIYILQRRLQIPAFKVQGYSKEGMPITIEAMIIFQIRSKRAPEVLRNLGADYLNTLVIPAAESSIRSAAAQYNSHELYTVDFDSLYQTILEKLPQSSKKDFEYYFDVIDVLVQKIAIPEKVIEAIQTKLRAEQEAAAYQFKLQAEKQEAERLSIQATGLRNFYTIVQDALTDKLLTWRGIDATVQIAKSPNTKIVIVGGGRNQLPLILGNDLTKADAAPAKDAAEAPDEAAPTPGSLPSPSPKNPNEATSRTGARQ